MEYKAKISIYFCLVLIVMIVNELVVANEQVSFIRDLLIYIYVTFIYTLRLQANFSMYFHCSQEPAKLHVFLRELVYGGEVPNLRAKLFKEGEVENDWMLISET